MDNTELLSKNIDTSINNVYCIKEYIQDFKTELSSIKELPKDNATFNRAYLKLLQLNKSLSILKDSYLESKEAKRPAVDSTHVVRYNDILYHLLPKLNSNAFEKCISGTALFKFLKDYRSSSPKVEIFVETFRNNSKMIIKFQLNKAICLNVYFSEAEKLEPQMVEFNGFNNNQTNLQDKKLHFQYKIDSFQVSKFRVAGIDKYSPTSSNLYDIKDNSIFDIIQSQLTFKWNSSFIENKSYTQSFFDLMMWFESYKTIFTKPCDYCNKILKFEGVIGIWAPPVIRVENTMQARQSDPFNNRSNTNITYSAYHLSFRYNDILYHLLPKLNSNAFEKCISGTALFKFLKDYRSSSPKVEIFVETFRNNSKMIIKFQLNKAICLNVYFSEAEKLEPQMVEFNGFNNNQTNLQDKKLHFQYKIDSFQVSKFRVAGIDKYSPTSSNLYDIKDNSIFDIIQSQLTFKWNSSFIENKSYTQSFFDLMMWFESYKTIFTKPCDYCNKILKFEGVIGIWAPPVIRVENTMQARQSDPFNNRSNTNITYSAYHFSCA
ncbi:hypothetical protein BB561_003965 [Smittium simulii]|uniref:Mediator of RNA polymerase II transcription subunit 27 n=1 Tax=Smittium simulii TaxID=133385 RepID=A0A2T9YIP5_9FUNG|nr:hypothetical protein BB561_003965 [Smittium simulii]